MLKIAVLFCFVLVAACCSYELSITGSGAQMSAPARPMQEPPPTPKPTPAEDTARYVVWLEKQRSLITDRPHEDVLLRLGDWGFFYHGDRPVGSWTPLLDRTALDRSGHAVTEKENSDWHALLATDGIDAAGALKRIAWLFNSDGLVPEEPGTTMRDKISAPSLTIKGGVITFQGWCEAHSDPPYKMRITIIAATTGNKLVIESGTNR